MTLPHYGWIDESGTLLWERPSEFSSACSALRGKKVVVTLRRRNRSLNQNALYWVYIQLYAEETGNELNQIHSAMKWLHLPHHTMPGEEGDPQAYLWKIPYPAFLRSQLALATVVPAVWQIVAALFTGNRE